MSSRSFNSNLVKSKSPKKTLLRSIGRFLVTKKKKSKSLMSSQLIPHFIRGYFDGDGHISEKNYIVNLVGTESFCQTIQNIITSLGANSKIYNTYYNKESSTRELKCSRKDSCEIFLDYIYQDAEIYLFRKHDIYLQRYYQNREIA